MATHHDSVRPTRFPFAIPLATAALAALCLAPTSSPQQPGVFDLCVLGPRRAVMVPISGFIGQLETDPLAVMTRAQIAAAVAAGFVAPDLLAVQEVIERHGGLGFGPLRSVPSLLDGDIPIGGLRRFAESSDAAELNRPLDCRVTMRLRTEPEHANFTRYLRFRDHDEDDRLLKLAFTRAHGLTFESTLPEGVGALQDLVDTGARSHWDQMALVNRGGTTRLEIAHLEVEIDYEVTDFLRTPTDTWITIPIVDWAIDSVLESGTAVVPLNHFAQTTRRALAGVDASFSRSLLLAVDDLGKSGSDGGTNPNPKYGSRTDLLCSEFVSWYYHQCGVSITFVPNEFRDITGTQQMHDLFRMAGRLYRFDSSASSQRFEDPDTGAMHTPMPGDFLEWRKDGAAMHSMMLLSYDPTTHVARVVNGPWPVRLMDVDLQWWEERTSHEHDFWLGAIPR